MLTLAQRVLAIDAALSETPHAFGGALALAYYSEPRATIDIDLNLFVPPERFSEVAGPLSALGADAGAPSIAALVGRDGQARVMWDETPIDLFFSYDRFHDAAARARHRVPFGDATIPILAADHLIVCKAVFSRPRDWVDIDSVLAVRTTVDGAEVLRWVARIAGDEDPRYNRIAALLTHRPPPGGRAGWGRPSPVQHGVAGAPTAISSGNREGLWDSPSPDDPGPSPSAWKAGT
ncbi:MAG TPA: nucleotidyl transferase AbiEii/AbiGii toxin family protein [Acidimicrobiales bacterium]|nr:nucleotidyl transferase AbiEii/AbiGii toxin family protein [Acidimicrobiales bacterium]